MLEDNVRTFLQTAMNHELSLAKQLKEIMSQEQSCLETQKINDIAKLLKEKSAMLEELEASTVRRLAIFGIKVSHTNQQQLFEQNIATDSVLVDQWSELKDAIFQCKTQNEVNGKIIHWSRNSIERTMNLLRQSLRPNNLTTYSANGKAQQTQLNMSSAKA